jgi:hypothetical protein
MYTAEIAEYAEKCKNEVDFPVSLLGAVRVNDGERFGF